MQAQYLQLGYENPYFKARKQDAVFLGFSTEQDLTIPDAEGKPASKRRRFSYLDLNNITNKVSLFLGNYTSTSTTGTLLTPLKIGTLNENLGGGAEVDFVTTDVLTTDVSQQSTKDTSTSFNNGFADGVPIFLEKVTIQFSKECHHVRKVYVDLTDIVDGSGVLNSSNSFASGKDCLEILCNPNEMIREVDFKSLPIGRYRSQGNTKLKVNWETFPPYGSKLYGLHDGAEVLKYPLGEFPEDDGGAAADGNATFLNTDLANRVVEPNGTVLEVIVGLKAVPAFALG